ncbi:MAG: hypothetical protein HZC02_00220 [Candidatus Levybacteria bacterium]|nr:hypothetical protein [Candidatus Levybacteria bacterium]
MITIIHGDDTASSRNYFNELKTKFSNTVTLDGESTSLTELMQEMDGGGLFVTSKTYLVEYFFKRRKKSSEFEAILSYIQSKTLEHEIFLWEDKELDKKSLSYFKHATIKTFKLPQTLFLFLDSIKPNAGKQLIMLHQRVLETIEGEMVFFMLVRQLRILLALSDQTDSYIDEVKRLAPWQAAKMQKQAKLFPKRELKRLYLALAQIDQDLKTGNLATPLHVSLDIFLSDI